jgi:hypothetical protein
LLGTLRFTRGVVRRVLRLTGRQVRVWNLRDPVGIHCPRSAEDGVTGGMPGMNLAPMNSSKSSRVQTEHEAKTALVRRCSRPTSYLACPNSKLQSARSSAEAAAARARDSTQRNFLECAKRYSAFQSVRDFSSAIIAFNLSSLRSWSALRSTGCPTALSLWSASDSSAISSLTRLTRSPIGSCMGS